MEATPPEPAPSPRRSTSHTGLQHGGENQCGQAQSDPTDSAPPASSLFLRRSSCRDYRLPAEDRPVFKRVGSLVALPSSSIRATIGMQAALPPGQTDTHVIKEREQRPDVKTCEDKPLSTPTQTDKSLFLSFENIKEVLFGDSKVLSPNKPGGNITSRSHTEKNDRERNKTRKDPSLQNDDKVQKSSGPVMDEFTEFSQYGSRFLPTQVNEEKYKKTNLVDQISGHRIVQKVAKTCQKHGKARKTSNTEKPLEDLNDRNENKKNVELPKSENVNIPTALPRSRREKQIPNTQATDKYKGEPEKLDVKFLEEKTAKLFKTSEPRHTISMNTDPKPQIQTLFEASKPSSSCGSIKLRGFSSKSDSDSGFDGDSVGEMKIKQVNIHAEYDLVQLIGEGWFSRVYLAEHRTTRDEVVLKAINSNLVTADEFCREYQSSVQLWPHRNILKVYDAVFQCDGYYMFAMEYAPLGDLTSNITEHALAEIHTKNVACQVGSALQWIHSKNLCHLDVKLDNILVFKSDFSLVKLCDFGSVKPSGDIVIKKNELLPYCPAELVAKHANEYYQVDKVQDVFQFGIVVFFCLLGVLPWQKADRTDPHYAEFCSWREKRTGKVPRNFKALSSRGQKLFRKLLEPNPCKRLELGEMTKYLEDKWLRKGMGKSEGKDGQSQLTLGSFQSVHSNPCEKNCLLYTLLQHGVETTVDRSSKNNRIRNWINQGAERSSSVKEEDIEEEPSDVLKDDEDDLEDIERVRIGTPE